MVLHREVIVAPIFPSLVTRSRLDWKARLYVLCLALSLPLTPSLSAQTDDRAVWHGEKFQKEFPAEKEYRHSLPEEVDGFQGVVDRVKGKIKKKEIQQLDPALTILVKLSDEGLLEPYILISRADKGISQDYPAYRDAHREKIRQYITEWIIHPAQ